MAEKTTYICTNDSCTLGTTHNPGRFTGGITQEQATSLTGDPEAAHGKGICPNCGSPGVAANTDEGRKLVADALLKDAKSAYDAAQQHAKAVRAGEVNT